MNLYTLAHGPAKDTEGTSKQDVRHGSIEKLMDGNLPLLPIAQVVHGAGLSLKLKEVHIPDHFDAVICNPPFTSTENQGSQYTKQTKKAMDERLTYIKGRLKESDPSAAAAIVGQSVGPYFTPLGNALLSQGRRGRLAKVIPATACTAKNGRVERQYLATNYHIDMIITSHDPKKINFSENTSIHECLLVGTREKNTSKATRFIQLCKYPDGARAEDKLQAADCLLDAIQGDEAGDYYTETLWPAKQMQAGDWTPVQWFNPKLARAAAEFDTLPKLIVANKVWGSKYLPRAFRSDFDYENVTHGEFNAFCTISENVMQTMQAVPETEARLTEKAKDKADKILSKAANLLLAERFSTTSSSLLAIYSEKPALGSAWCAIKLKDGELARAFVAFLNSSFGVIQLLNRRTKKLTYPQYEVGHLDTLLLPDPSSADLSPLLAAFEELKDTPLRRLADCAIDPSRRLLDHAAARSIGIAPARTDAWRTWLSQEPTITNQPVQASK